MSEFKVKTELPASRCEICHKSDQFDPEKGYCLRCQNLSINEQNKVSIITQKDIKKDLVYKKISLSFKINTVVVTTLLMLTYISGNILLAGGITCIYLVTILYTYMTISLSEVYPWVKENPKFSPTNIGEFAQLDHLKLQQYSFEIKALGFIRLGDYKEDYSGELKTFSRVFFHPKHNCFATIDQFFSPSQMPLPIALAISSYMEEGWSLSSTKTINPVLANQFIYRLPKRLWKNYPEKTLKEILDLHIENRNNMLRKLEIILLNGEEPLKRFLEINSKIAQEFKEINQDRSIVSLMKDQLFLRVSPRDEWLGNYKP